MATNNDNIAGAEKDKALSLAISQLEKRYGSGAFLSLGDSMSQKVEAYSTGSLSPDIALGIGGIPQGRISEIQTSGLLLTLSNSLNCLTDTKAILIDSRTFASRSILFLGRFKEL